MRLRGWALVALGVGLGAAFHTLAAAPPGWTIAGNAPADFEFAVDATDASIGKHSASITAKSDARPNGFGTLMQIIAADDYRGSRLQLSGYLRTQAANRAQMWMRVDGPGGRILGFDNMDSRPVTGTTAWQRYDIVLDVPTDSVDIAFGFLLINRGKVWGDDFKLDKVDSVVRVTSGTPTLPRVPVNLDFEDTASSRTADAKEQIARVLTLRGYYSLGFFTHWKSSDKEPWYVLKKAPWADPDLLKWGYVPVSHDGKHYLCLINHEPPAGTRLGHTYICGDPATAEMLYKQHYTPSIRSYGSPPF